MSFKRGVLQNLNFHVINIFDVDSGSTSESKEKKLRFFSDITAKQKFS